MHSAKNRRILLVDDNPDIHDDFRKILKTSESSGRPKSARAAFFGEGEEQPAFNGPVFELTSAMQGSEGIELMRRARAENRPYALAFVDIRMPPGIDGLQTIKQTWEVDEDIQVVICTAFSDYSFEEIVDELGDTERLLILKKPFDPVEVRQLAVALTEKWNVIQRERNQLEDLREANLRAQAASRAKSQFLTNMSHEIRTPMNAILGYVDLLCDPESTQDERYGYGETIRKSGQHLLTILNDILDISKIEAGRMKLHFEELSPFETAKEALSLFLPQAAEKDIALELEVESRLPASVESDSVRLRQILLNLVGNAIKFTFGGSVRLAIALEQKDGAPPELVFRVADTGVGIDPDHLPRLFDSFHQADMSVTRTQGGTGLGLTISRRLARMLGGDIRAESALGKGSTFSFRVPLRSEPGELVAYSDEDVRLERPESGVDPGRTARLRGNVLIVEDGKFNQALLAAVFRRSGAEVTLADNGEEGCRAVSASQESGRPVDLIVMDMQMPVLDGYEATRRIRAEGYGGPIIALTAHAMSGDREKCIAAGCDEYVTKPLDRRELLETCLRLMEPRAALPASSRRAPVE